MREPSGRVCLDPGHDAGNLANKSPDGTYYEHEFTLDLGKRLEKLLTDRGVAVTMTRTGGEAVSLAKRCEIANSIPDLDLFVSLHSNAAAGSGWSSAEGWSIYLYGPGGRREQAAQDILEQVRHAGYFPLIAHPERYTYMEKKDYIALHEEGYEFQLNLMSLSGYYNPGAKAVSEWLLKKGMYTYVGSDLHHLERYQPMLEEMKLTAEQLDALSMLIANNEYI